MVVAGRTTLRRQIASLLFIKSYVRSSRKKILLTYFKKLRSIGTEYRKSNWVLLLQGIKYCNRSTFEVPVPTFAFLQLHCFVLVFFFCIVLMSRIVMLFR